MKEIEINIDAKKDWERFNLTKERANELVNSIAANSAQHPLNGGELSFNVFLEAAFKVTETLEEALFLSFMCGRTKQVGEAMLSIEGI